MKVSLKRSQWECYTDTPDSIIETINGYFSMVLTTEETPIDAQAEIYKFLGFYKEFGFSDSECSQVATNVINNYFKSNLTRWDAPLRTVS